MIVFDLQCEGGHRFEGWFGSSSDYERQHTAGLIACPQCASTVVGKAVMAPAVGRKGNQPPTARTEIARADGAGQPVVPTAGGVGAKPTPLIKPATSPALPPEAIRVMHALATMQAKALENSRWVGERFAEGARAMHYGEREVETIHGRASPEEAEALVEEGIVVMPLPFPVAPPDQLN